MVQSAHIWEIGKFAKTMHKNTYPLVVCYNGRDHYTLTRSSSPEKFYRWKMQKELGPVLSAALFIIEEIDRTKLPANVLTEVNGVEAQIVKSIPIISTHSNSSHLRHGAMTDICNKKRDRKSDLDGHLLEAHRIGEPIQCNISPCNQRNFSTKGALRSHIKTQHKKKFEHNCPACNFGCESIIYYVEHRTGREICVTSRRKWNALNA